MKRSEMIDLIGKRLNPIGICEETCAEILDIIEKAGMTPPKTKFLGRGLWGGIAIFRVWEPEDEKK